MTEASKRRRSGPRRPLGACLVLACALWVAHPATAETQPVPVIVVPGISGTQLEDPATGRLIWGRTRQLLKPRDRGYAVALPLELDRGTPHPQESYRPLGPVWRMNLGLWKKQIYGPLAAHLERAGYRLGRLDNPAREDSLFFFDYDWRRSTASSARLLGETIAKLDRARGGGLQVDLVCQSNASKICRYLVKYGVAPLDQADADRESSPGRHVRKVILVGASNDGALRVLAFLNRGRRYIPLIGRKVSQETFFTLRSLFDDLPARSDDLFFDDEGRRLAIDLFDAETWVKHGWSVFDPKVRRRLARRERADLFGTEDDRLRHLRRQLERAQRFQKLLVRDSPDFPPVRYYRLENQSKPTMVRALLRRGKKGWKTHFFGDRAVGRNRSLRALAATPGDGHASLESQRALSPQEEAALVDAAMIRGGHFEMILEPEGLDAIVSFLRD